MAKQERAFFVDNEGNKKPLTVDAVSTYVSDEGKIGIPKGMVPEELLYWAKFLVAEANSYVEISEPIDAFPLDGAYALQKAARNIFGFYKPLDPKVVNLAIDAKGNKAEVFVGSFELPGVDGAMATVPVWETNQLVIKGQIKRKDMTKVQQLLALTRRVLIEESIYKGKAIKLKWNRNARPQRFDQPSFMDTTDIGCELIVNRATQRLLTASLFNLIQRPEQTAELGIARHTGILLHGDYGTGKTLTAKVTAALCEAHGISFVYCEQVEDLPKVYELAQKLQPCVVFAEDVDRLLGLEQDPNATQLSSILDGINTKSSEIMLVMTTNHLQKIPKILLRPGRINASVFFPLPDAASASKLVLSCAKGRLHDGFDHVAVGKVLAGQKPAVIAEVVSRSFSYALEGLPKGASVNSIKLRTEDIIDCYEGMQEHLAELNRKETPEPTELEKLGHVLGAHVKAGMQTAVQEAIEGGHGRALASMVEHGTNGLSHEVPHFVPATTDNE